MRVCDRITIQNVKLYPFVIIGSQRIWPNGNSGLLCQEELGCKFTGVSEIPCGSRS